MAKNQLKNKGVGTTVASQIINAAKVTVDAMKLIKQEGASESEMPLIFGDQKKAILN